MKYPPINAKFPHMLHGGDYNPEQWRHMPEVLREDIRLMKFAGCNAMSVGIFAWTALEPCEGEFDFSWLDRIMDDFAKNGIYAVLATPSGARPAWMAQRYPEVLRVQANGQRNHFGRRHNHCFTSPVYREKVRLINTKLAERYQNHPALLVWHVSNEYSGECYCDLCQQAFRKWVQARYANNLDELNAAWYTAFWSHTYTDWSQIEPPMPHGECYLHGLKLDWKRFVTAQTVDFIRNEIAPLKAITPGIPVTTNLMGTFPGLDYWKIAEVLDVVSWDSYPEWHHGDDEDLAFRTAYTHNLNRSLKNGRPFMLMESTPSVTNWQSYSKLKRPGMHLLSSLQAVAHGADTVQYFQWRKSRGSSEKFHGAVVDHVGHEHTRVFRDVAEVGKALEKLDNVVGTAIPADVALIFDWENRWALEDAQGPRNDGLKAYDLTCQQHVKSFWRQGIPFDVINMDCDFSQYKVLIAPMLYMLRPGVGERIEEFVSAGGTFVSTYLSGWVNETDLCFLGGFPGPLCKVLGIWSEEIDALDPTDANTIIMASDNPLGLTGSYEASIFCDLIHTEGAKTLATYAQDFYAGRPALTLNNFGQGAAYYMAARQDARFLDDFYRAISKQHGLRRPSIGDIPTGVNVQFRTDGKHDYLFVMNFTDNVQSIVLEQDYIDLLAGHEVSGSLLLAPYGVRVLSTLTVD